MYRSKILYNILHNIFWYNREVRLLEQIVYLDNSSTTKPCRLAVEYTARALEENWGNPSSLHILGVNAETEVTRTRGQASALLHCRPDEVFFTGSGTEANNTALFGAVQRMRKRGNRIVTTAIEHPSVLESIKELEKRGYEVIYLKPDSYGHISKEQLYESINADTILVSIMLVNNELGSVLPVREAARAIKNAGSPALFHCDAVQAFGKLPVDVRELGVDLLSASGHKIHGPKGIGLLYVRKGLALPPLLLGGGQEKGLRSGTEPVPAILGLSGALKELPDIKAQLKKIQTLRDYAAEKLKETGFCELNSPEDALPYILNISVPGYRSETLLHFLEAKNIYVSSGSACSKGAGSYVLNSCELPRDRVDSALRLSFCRDNSERDIDLLCEVLENAVSKLRRGNI